MFRTRPNRLSYLAATYPIRYSLASGLVVGVFAIGATWSLDSRVVRWSCVAASVAFIVAVNIVLWRPGGAGSRWYGRSFVQDGPANERPW